ncbi:MAG: hypothetical protein MR030_07975 [Bacteroidales bacterium]|nr:hypothetical protein [Bacteroidales bacterium]
MMTKIIILVLLLFRNAYIGMNIKNIAQNNPLEKSIGLLGSYDNKSITFSKVALQSIIAYYFSG